MKTGTTKSGFKFKIDENRLDDMEFVDVLQESTDNNPLAISKALTIMLGAEQKKKLYDHLRTEDGRVPIEKTMLEWTEIMELAQAKNS